MKNPKTLRRNQLYDREAIARILAPDYAFRASTGTWGLHGIIRFGNGPNYAFFVTYGQSQGEHLFDEGIDSSGRLRWQSQPSQDLSNRVIRDLISHDELLNDVLLFLRVSSHGPYIYLGKLKYLTHDAERVRPVHFQWKILNFDPEAPALKAFGLTLESATSAEAAELDIQKTIEGQRAVQVSRPTETSGVALGVTTSKFNAKMVDYEERDRRNRQIGMAGEKLILAHEINRLLFCGRTDLAERVEHVSLTQGDGTGYDILSFDPISSQELFIEVKTSTGPAHSAFFMTAQERSYALSAPSGYRLYRVFNFDPRVANVEFFILDGTEVIQCLEFTPTNFRVRLK